MRCPLWLCWLLAVAAAAGGPRRHGAPRAAQNVTSLLNQLLQGYDTRLRPNFAGGPTIIKTDINIRSMGPISEVDMTYSMDCYFRQTWVDKRLQFDGKMREMAVHIKMLQKLWKPDTFFYNGQGSYLHTITTPNKLLRIKPDGTVLYSMRLTIKASCPMYLQYFPVDQQQCPLQLGSYAYTKDQVVYVWKHGGHNSIKVSAGMTLSQFDLVSMPASNGTVRNRSGEFSTLHVQFVLVRHMGYFLIQVYVPCTLIVILSWVSFWLNREATADRIGLGITTVLTLTTLSMDTRTDLPKVPYATGMDWFIIICFVFVIASMLEYAGVHYFTKIGSGEIEPDSEDDDEDDDDGDNHYLLDKHYCPNTHPRMPTTYIQTTKYNNQFSYRTTVTSQCRGYNSTNKPGLPRGASDATPRKKEPFYYKFFKCLVSDATYKKHIMRRQNPTGHNSTSQIDRVSRCLFPLSFIACYILYWVSYLK